VWVGPDWDFQMTAAALGFCEVLGGRTREAVRRPKS